MSKRFTPAYLVAIWLPCCSTVHHVHLSEVDTRSRGEPIEVRLSEVGVDLEAAGAVLAARQELKPGDDGLFGNIAWIISLFQMGPKTGNIVFSSNHGAQLRSLLVARCPKGWIRNVVSVRETRDFWLASQEEVVVKAECVGTGT